MYIQAHVHVVFCFIRPLAVVGKGLNTELTLLFHVHIHNLLKRKSLFSAGAMACGCVSAQF